MEFLPRGFGGQLLQPAVQHGPVLGLQSLKAVRNVFSRPHEPCDGSVGEQHRHRGGTIRLPDVFLFIAKRLLGTPAVLRAYFETAEIALELIQGAEPAKPRDSLPQAFGSLGPVEVLRVRLQAPQMCAQLMNGLRTESLFKGFGIAQTTKAVSGHPRFETCAG